jgi:hypothetical protein
LTHDDRGTFHACSSTLTSKCQLVAFQQEGGREPGRQLCQLSFIPRIHAMTCLAAEVHILTATAGALAHHAMMPAHMVHMALVMQLDHLGQIFRSELRAWNIECSGLRQWRNPDGNSNNQAASQSLHP